MDRFIYSNYSSPSTSLRNINSVDYSENLSNGSDEIYDRVQRISTTMAQLKAHLAYEKEMLKREKIHNRYSIDDFKIKDYSTSSTPYISSPGQKDDLTHHPGITTNASNFYQTYCEPYPYDPRLEHTTKETYLDKKKYLHQSKYQNKYEDNDYPVMDIEFVVNMEKDQNELDLNNKLKFDKERRGILEKVLYHQQLLDVDRQCKIEKKNMDKLSKATERILRGGRGDGEAHRRHRRTRHRSRS